MLFPLICFGATCLFWSRRDKRRRRNYRSSALLTSGGNIHFASRNSGRLTRNGAGYQLYAVDPEDIPLNHRVIRPVVFWHAGPSGYGG